MNLETIGFYTLYDKRAKEVSDKSRLKRCELILTNRCNFNCPYCRGFKKDDKKDLSKEEAYKIVDMWSSQGLENIRFSGGEPTIWPHLIDLVKHSVKKNINRIAVSTNGSATTDYYFELANAGVNDFSISLDSCCSSVGNKMAGKKDIWETIIHNIKELSKITYVTVGVVLTNENYYELNDIISFASSLGVADIRIIPAAQDSKKLQGLQINDDLLKKHPILFYRYKNFKNGRGVRGLQINDNNQCPLVLDDMAILNGKHYPCIIYMRELGKPIGKINNNIREIREQRKHWFENHNCFEDDICKNNCLDVCIDYNNKVKILKK